MTESKPSPVIRLRGVRHNNLKNFDLDLPLHRLIVITGLSGSGKSSLAFDTLYARGSGVTSKPSRLTRGSSSIGWTSRRWTASKASRRHRHRTAQRRPHYPLHRRHDDRDLRPHESPLAAPRTTPLPRLWESRAEGFAAERVAAAQRAVRNAECGISDHVRPAAFGKALTCRIPRVNFQARLPTPVIQR